MKLLFDVSVAPGNGPQRTPTRSRHGGARHQVLALVLLLVVVVVVLCVVVMVVEEGVSMAVTKRCDGGRSHVFVGDAEKQARGVLARRRPSCPFPQAHDNPPPARPQVTLVMEREVLFAGPGELGSQKLCEDSSLVRHQIKQHSMSIRTHDAFVCAPAAETQLTPGGINF